MSEDNGGKHSSIERDQIQQMRRDFDASTRRNQIYGRKVAGWSLLFSVTIFVAIITTPKPFPMLIGFVLLAWGLWGAWAQRPGRCVICQRVTLLSMPTDTYVERKPIQYWRPQPRHMSFHVCSRHLDRVMFQHILDHG